MLAEQSLSMHPLTHVSSPVGRFSLSHDTMSPSSGASRSPSNHTDSPHEDSSGSTVSEFTPIKSSNGSLGEESMSPLERLQYFGQNTVFSHVFQGDDEPGSPAKSLQNGISTVLEDKHRLSNSPGFGLTHQADDENAFGNGYALPKVDIQSDHTDLEYMDSTDENGNRGSPSLDKAEFEAGVAGSNVFQCPICRISCSNRHQFNDHIVSHSHQRVCPKCTFSTTEEEALKAHLQEAHGVQDPEAIPADDEIRVPKVNSQGKLKTFKCKQCEYTAVTKLDFWEHSKSHIRPEKMLSCPKCPFVTEYKHHLEYHLRNHFDSKPFKCTKCQYSCVNKSMLNSHLKSHSSVYQYRCADCAYATKYCHSLKLHLRKYKHEPSMVLNLDGTPNPLPIIDVYGTRRGPKIKRTDVNGSDSVTDYNGNNSTSANSNLVKTELMDSPKAPKQKGKRATGNGRRGKKYADSGSDEAHTDDSSQDRTKYFNGHKGTSASPRYDNSPKATPPSSVETFSPRSTASDVETGYPLAAPTPAAVGKNPMELYAAAAAVNQYLYYPWLSQLSQLSQLNPNLVNLAKEQQMLLAQLMNNQNQSESIKNQINQGLLGVVSNASNMKPYPLVGGLKPSYSSPPPLVDASSSAPLDLRHPKLSPSAQAPMDCAPINLAKRKRKMKTASRNSKSVLEDEHDPEVALDFSKKASPPPSKNYCAARSSPSPSEAKMCKYCEISFPDQLLYSVHMSFHSSSADPFLCKSCGKRTQDKLSFFVHLTTAPH